MFHKSWMNQHLPGGLQNSLNNSKGSPTAQGAGDAPGWVSASSRNENPSDMKCQHTLSNVPPWLQGDRVSHPNSKSTPKLPVCHAERFSGENSNRLWNSKWFLIKLYQVLIHKLVNSSSGFQNLLAAQPLNPSCIGEQKQSKEFL